LNGKIRKIGVLINTVKCVIAVSVANQRGTVWRHQRGSEALQRTKQHVLASPTT